jgi:type VI secretion system protein ImpB
MPNEGSVAPKERVNIVYKPATGDAQSEVELPLKTLVVGDFTLRDDATPVEERKCINIDKDNFNEVLKAQNVVYESSVKNLLSDDPDAMLNMSLKFSTMQDFEPDAIVKNVPELQKMIDLREALKALKGPLGNVPDFRKKIQDLVQDESARAALLKELGIQ